jgi:hypothetical protein
MSSEKHPNLQLHKWAPTDYVRREEWNDNFGIIDVKIGILNKKTDGIVSVKEFGAKGDGVADDTQAFLDALNYLKSRGGGVLFVPPSNNKYIVTSQIQWDETFGHIVFIGAGRASHIYLAQHSPNGHLLGVIGSNTNEANWVQSAIIKDLQLSTFTTVASVGDNDNCIGISKAKNILIENVYVSYSRWKGITVQGNVKNIVYKNLQTENCQKYGLGTEFSTVSDIKVINCISNNNGEQGAMFTSAGDGSFVKGLFIDGLVTHNNTLEGVSFSGVKGGSAIGIHSYENKGEGIKTYNCSNLYVKGTSRDNDLAGVRTILGTGNIFEIDSRNNSLNDANNRGNFFIESTPNVKLVNCIGNEGVRSITNWSDNCTILNCLLDGTTNGVLSTSSAQSTEGIVLHSTGKKIAYGSSAPTSGSFKRGDIIYNTSPSAGGSIGWVCVSEGKAHQPSTGDLTNGSNQILNVTNISTWSVGDRIQASGIPFGTTITNISGTTITINNNATANGNFSLYDAVFKTFGTISS